VSAVSTPPEHATIDVLIVEDHADTRDMLQQSLTAEGAVVIAAATARDALVDIPNADVVVTDLAMPNNVGIWLLNEINALLRPVPVIVMSGFHESQHAQLRAAPFIRKLLKPVEPRDLSRVIREVLRGVTVLSEQSVLLLGLLKPESEGLCIECVSVLLRCSPAESLKATKELISNGYAIGERGPCARCFEIRLVTCLRRSWWKL